MSIVVVKESLFRWAIERSDHTIEELRRKFPRIQDWINGKHHPTLRQLEKFARTTLTPLGFFFLAEPPDEKLPIPHFRTLGDAGTRNPSPDLIDTIRMMQRRQAWMREYLIEEGQEPLPFVASAKIGDQATEIAEAIRVTLGLDAEWAARQSTWEDALRVLRESIDDVGILVVVNGIVGNSTRRKLDPKEFRGFVLVDEFAPLVFVNGSDSKAAQMFTLGHELAHVFLGSSAAFDLRGLQPADDPRERWCNLVAAEFLVPEQALRDFWHKASGDLDPFQIVARRFKVSVLVAARRALDLGLIDRNRFFDFYNEYQQLDKTKASTGPGGDFYATQNYRVGKRFAATVARATYESKLLYSEAYHLTGLYGATFENYVSSFSKGASK